MERNKNTAPALHAWVFDEAPALCVREDAWYEVPESCVPEDIQIRVRKGTAVYGTAV